MQEKKTELRPVVVCTDKRGVFFGYLVGEPSREKVLLERARMCVKWSSDVRGVFGLASKGPSALCRVSPPAPDAELVDIHCVLSVTPEAVEAWERGPWG